MYRGGLFNSLRNPRATLQPFPQRAPFFTVSLKNFYVTAPEISRYDSNNGFLVMGLDLIVEGILFI